MITAVERPGRLAYDMTAVYQDAPGFSTTVEVRIEAEPDGNRVRLVQQGVLDRAHLTDAVLRIEQAVTELRRGQG